MARRRTGIALLAVSLALLLSPAVAGAAIFRGETGQRDTQIKLRTNARGVVTRALVEWRADCRAYSDYRDETLFLKPFDRSRRSGFRDAGRYGGKLRHGFRVRHRTELEGVRVGPRRFRGTFRISARYTRRGRYVTTCRSGLVRWSATRRR